MIGRPRLQVNEEEFTKMYQNRVPTADIAQHFGISKSSVCNLHVRLNIPVRRRFKIRFDEKKYRRLFNSGITYSEMSILMGISTNSVMEIRKLLNLSARKRGRKIVRR